jgi:hypothetical protein
MSNRDHNAVVSQKDYMDVSDALRVDRYLCATEGPKKTSFQALMWAISLWRGSILQSSPIGEGNLKFIDGRGLSA